MEKNSYKVRMIAYTAMVAAAYVVITLMIAPLGYGVVQVRISEALVLLAFVDKRYAPGLILGCFIANCFSPFGLIDMVFGTACSAAAMVGITRFSKTLFGASLWSVFCNAFIGVELYFLGVLGDYSLVMGMLSVAAGQFLSVSVIGYVVFRQIMKNGALVERLRIA